MLTQDQTRTAYELLRQADSAFSIGDNTLASQKLWDAFAETVKAIGSARGLPCRDDDDILQILQKLANAETDYLSLVVDFHTARRFRDAAAEGGPKDYEVEFLAPEVRIIVDEFAALA